RWKLDLGLLGLNVVSFEEFQRDPNLGPILFHLDKRPKALYMLPTTTSLPSEERERLDRGETFSAQFLVFSNMSQGASVGNRAELLDEKEEKKLADLAVSGDPKVGTRDPESALRMYVEPPEAGAVRGPAQTVTAFFRFDGQAFSRSRVSA